MSSAEWGPLVEVPSHLTSPVALFSLWSCCWFGSHWSLWRLFWELHHVGVATVWLSLTSFLNHLGLCPWQRIILSSQKVSAGNGGIFLWLYESFITAIKHFHIFHLAEDHTGSLYLCACETFSKAI